MELKVKRDKVLAAAKKCSRAKEVLEEMFPEAFEVDKSVDLNPLAIGPTIIQVRNAGKYKNKAFYLSRDYHWRLTRDSSDELCLIPTKKQ